MTDVLEKYIYFRSKPDARRKKKLNLLCVLSKYKLLGSLRWPRHNLLSLEAKKKINWLERYE